MKDLKVLHAIEDIEAHAVDNDVILVLDDANVLDHLNRDGDGDDDEDDDADADADKGASGVDGQLINVEMVQHRRRLANERQKLLIARQKNRIAQYETDTTGGNILAKYDEFDDEVEAGSFTLGSLASIPPRAKRHVADPAKMTDSLEWEVTNKQPQDYYTPEEAPALFKKRRNKKPKSTRQDGFFELPDSLFANSGADTKKKSKDATGSGEIFVDDEDLQAVLTRTRRKAIKHQQTASSMPTDSTSNSVHRIAEEIRQHSTQEPETLSSGTGVVLTAVSEFVRSIQLPTGVDETETVEMVPAETKSEMNRGDAFTEDKMGDVEMVEAALESTETKEHVEENDKGVREIMQEPEPVAADRGVASFLAMLKHKGVLQPTSTDRDKEKAILDRERLMVQQRKIRESTLAAVNPDPHAMETRDTDHHEQAYFKQRTELMANYKPIIHIEHKDEFGRVLDAKEAYKLHSRKFHGTDMNKKKQAKLMDSLKQEREQMQKSLFGIENSGSQADGRSSKREKRRRSQHVELEKDQTLSTGGEMPTTAQSSPQPHSQTPSIQSQQPVEEPPAKREKIKFGFKPIAK